MKKGSFLRIVAILAGFSIVLFSDCTAVITGDSSGSTSGKSIDETGAAVKAPTDLVATAFSSTRIDLSWKDNSTDETGFKIERSEDNLVWTVILSTQSNVISYQNTGLSPSTKYYYRVMAFNASATSVASNIAYAVTFSVMAAPTYLVATAVSGTQINLAWNDNSTNETGFRIERSPNNSTWTEIATVNADVKSYQNTGLTASTTYYYRVRAWSANQASDYSNVANATTQGTLSAPTSLSASVSSATSIHLSWIDNSTTETGFKLERMINNSTWSDFATLGANVTSYDDTGLTTTITYSYRVRAYQGTTYSAYSNTAQAMPTASGSKPTISAPSTSTGTFTISMGYTFTGMFGSSSDGYYLEQSSSPTSGFTVVNQSATTRSSTYSVTMTKPNGTYYFRVRVYNTSAYSQYSDVVSVAVTVPAAKATLQIMNSTKYFLVDIQLNGTQYLTTIGSVIGVNSSVNIDFPASGTVSYVLGAGFWDGSFRDSWWYLKGTVNVTLGTTTTLTFNNPTINQLLCAFGNNRSYNCITWDANLVPHEKIYTFTSSGTWTLKSDGVQTGSGTYALVSWQNYASNVTFSLCSSCPTATISYPFGSFVYNGLVYTWK